jgi:CubicO group peptidase (beta-lactamase class C family)
MSTRLVHGSYTPHFSPLVHKLSHNLSTGNDLGASIFVSKHNETLVDIWGGYSDAARSQPWAEDTITTIWSTTKLVTALAALVCIERGLLDPDERVATYWPEFAQAGKHDVKVWQVLSHASGLSTWAQDVSMEDVMDVEATTKMLEGQAPLWEPGTRSGYHGLTMGNLVGELILRVTGKSLDVFVQDEIAGPVGADFSFGVTPEQWHRVAEIIPLGPVSPDTHIPNALKDPQSVMFRSFMNPMLDSGIANTAPFRATVLGAANGFSNARGIVRILSRLLDPKFISVATLDKVFAHKPSESNVDLVIGKPVRFGLGFGIVDKDTWVDWAPEGRVLTWGGLGGSVAVVDLERGVVISYVMNRMAHHIQDGETERRDRFKEYVDAVYQELGEGEKVP